ncbi:MSMEG_0567/sll0787 family protein [Curtobacterium sp. NPDC089185]|uniref:MSMEG_0567/sll0787 family protein n=1 Tax=Curtobacterium sp. NPDC089185 TaxID=3154968 RepID=UPI00342ED16E
MEVPALMGPAPTASVAPAPFVVGIADAVEVAAYRRLRHDAFVDDQGLFDRTDVDHLDQDHRTVVLVARATDGSGAVLGGVRVAPATVRDIGWWTGSRLVVGPAARNAAGVGSALVRAACALVEQRGALRFDALVQERAAALFTRIGWQPTGREVLGGVPHLRMRWPVDRYQRLVDATKAHLAALFAGARPGGAGWVGDDGAPLAGTDVIAACDAILPSMVERDPEWAGWCGVLVNVNDLTAMGAAPTALLDAVAGRDTSFVARVVAGLRRASDAWGVPIIGGHTQVGVPAALSVTALGRTEHPVPGGGARPGQRISLTADLSGGWRTGHTGAQWNSTEGRDRAALRDLAATVGRARPAAAKDVSMAGIVGTAGMLAEASGGGAVLDVADVPIPRLAATADWLGCFPGFAMLTADDAGASRMASPAATTRECGEVTSEPGVRLRWPDGEETTVVTGGVTGFGSAAA